MERNRSTFTPYPAEADCEEPLETDITSRSDGRPGIQANSMANNRVSNRLNLSHDSNNATTSASYNTRLNETLQAPRILGMPSFRDNLIENDLNLEYLRTSHLLNQFNIRQDQINQYAQRLAIMQGTNPSHQTFQLYPQQSSSQVNSFAGSNTQLLDLLQSNEFENRQVAVLKQLQDLQASASLGTSALPTTMSISLNQLEQQIFKQQQIERQTNLALLQLNAGRGLDSNLWQAAALSRHSELNTIPEEHFLSGAIGFQQSTPSAVAIDRIRAQQAATLLSTDTLQYLKPHDETSALEIKKSNAKSGIKSIVGSSRTNREGRGKVRPAGRTGKFPQKLHKVLNDLQELGRGDIAAFLPNGQAFAIFNTVEFANDIMPRYFRMSRYSSFQRQLNLYDFQRITEGPDRGAYHHPMFIQGQSNISSSMKRNKIKGVAGKGQKKLASRGVNGKATTTDEKEEHDSDEDNSESDDESERAQK